MKALVLCPVSVDVISNAGIYRKILGQKAGLTSRGYDVDLVTINNGEVCLNNHTIAGSLKFLNEPIKTRLFFYRRMNQIVDIKGYQLIFIRHRAAMLGFDDFVRNVKELNPLTRIVLEIPTFPYAEEWEGPHGKVVETIDKRIFHKASSYLDLVCHPGEEKIFGLPTLQMDNAIEIENPDLPPNLKSNDGLSMVAVGKWQFWHGLDRVIEGIHRRHNLARENKIELSIVGEGKAIPALKKMTKEYDLNDIISFVGPMGEPELFDLLKKDWIGIGTLGLHRKGVKINSSLKHRLYCSFGVPFILSRKDDSFDEKLPFVRYFSDDDNEIDLAEVVAFYKEMLVRPMIRHEMQDHARSELDWSSRMSSMLSFLDLPVGDLSSSSINS